MTIGGTTHVVEKPFLVMATQNPIESEGTYPLPEAQVDRFMLKVLVDYPAVEDEHTVAQRALADSVDVAHRDRAAAAAAGCSRRSSPSTSTPRSRATPCGSRR